MVFGKLSLLLITALCTALPKENILVTCVRRLIAKTMGFLSRANLDARALRFCQFARGNLDARVRTVFPWE